MDANINLFEYASRNQLRFETIRGVLSTEDLWEIPLTSKNGFDLDAVAKKVNAELKATSEESFVNTETNPNTVRLENTLNLVKHIIATKIRENQEAKARLGRAAEKKRLLEILESKQQEKMLGMTEEQILARIAELG